MRLIVEKKLRRLWKNKRNAGFAVSLLMIPGMVSAIIIPSQIAGDRYSKPEVSVHFTQSENHSASEINNPIKPRTLRLMTLNLAHGRKDSASQLLLNKSAIRKNLDAISQVIVRETVDVVAFQEADGPCLWSGNFDHINYLAEQGNFEFSTRGEHIKTRGFSYGTAIISKNPLKNAQSIRFEESYPTFPKGFIISSINWEGIPGQVIDVVSLHLDFSRKSVRRHQVDELIGILTQNKQPIVIMGDFNCSWNHSDSPLGTLTRKLKLKAYDPDNPSPKTFPLTGKRLDWILISEDLDFISYETLADPLSDHLAVIAEIQPAD
ncbi:MAG TPA: hypothetical protein EYQ50_13295 [Verrucomicrobiales bacterium]|nr:hypothetical protein [Verrucomicrobiales bacterium]HIL69640.1 hypothetical protein [Verrucomicrobiota bacterium]